MVQPREKVFRDNLLQRPFIKPCSPVCKRLFDFSDPTETKRMLDDMLLTENQRLKQVWNFDTRYPPSAARKAPNPREESHSSSMSPCTKRFEWELQERQNVPSYYSRPCHPHHSEARNLQSPRRTGFFCPQKQLKDCEHQRASLQPLGCRDENASPVKEPCRICLPSKRAATFVSPPKISSGNLNPSFVRLVTALRIPLPQPPAQSTQATCLPPPPSADESKKSISDVSHDTPFDVTDTKTVLNIATTVNSAPSTNTVTSKAPASRRLFVSRQNKRRCDDNVITSKQPKITDVLSQRKLRSTSTKRPRQESINQVQAATSSSQ